jgi:hypothetical protein
MKNAQDEGLKPQITDIAASPVVMINQKKVHHRSKHNTLKKRL